MNSMNFHGLFSVALKTEQNSLSSETLKHSESGNLGLPTLYLDLPHFPNNVCFK